MAPVASVPSSSVSSKRKRPSETDESSKRVRTEEPEKEKKPAVINDSQEDEEDLEALVDNLPDPLADVEDGGKASNDEGLTLPKVLLSVDVGRDTSTVQCPVFKQMCEKIFADEHFTHIIDYLDAYGVSKVWLFVNGLIESNVNLKKVVEEGLWQDIAALLAIDGKAKSVSDEGWYLNIITADDNIMYIKEYVGQGIDIRKRIRGHHNELKNRTPGRSKSLLYRIAGVPGRNMNFVLLGKYTAGAIIPMMPPLLDLVEMYFALLFQTLTRPALEKWLPSEVALRDEIGLNVALPLYQASLSDLDRKRAKRSTLDLRHSTDPEIRQQFHVISREAAAKGRESMAAQNWVPNSKGWQNKSKKPIRGALEGVTREEQVEILCSKCKSPASRKMDPNPLYRISDGMYVAREQSCDVCPPKKINEKTGGVKRATAMHHPVDGRPKISLTKVK